MGIHTIHNCLKELYNNNKTLLANCLYVGIVQIFGLIAPLITYPYLVERLGLNLYGIILTAQVLASYVTIIVDFGSNKVSAKNISIYRDDSNKLSEVLSSILCIRFYLWILCFGLYFIIISLVPLYREYRLLFILSYLLTLYDLLFPQFFFQGLEKMRLVSILNVIIKLIFIILVFIFVRGESDYLLVPVLYAIGYIIVGAISLYIIFSKYSIKFNIPPIKIQYSYFKECLPVMATDLVCTIKDKLNYMFVGGFVGAADVVIYDLGLKFSSLITMPTNVITSVVLPKFAKNRSVSKIRVVLYFVLLMTIILVSLLNIFMQPIVRFFIDASIDLVPLRIFSLAPIFLCAGSVIANNFYIGFGYTKYCLYSIIITTIAYIVVLLFIWLGGYIHSIYSFVFLSVIAYFVEFVFRLITFYSLSKRVK